MTMKKICLFCPNGLPVPATLGGATETLLTTLVSENEILNKYKFVVYAVYEKNAEILSSKYKNTEFRLISITTYDKLLNFIFKVIRKLTKRELYYFDSPWPRRLKECLQDNFDAIVLEGHYGCVNALKKYKKKDKIVMHSHHAFKYSKNELNNFDVFLFVSEFQKEYYFDSDFTNKEFASKSFILKNKVDLDLFNPQNLSIQEKKECREKYFHVTDDTDVILFCGRIIKEKGIAELIDAFCELNLPKTKLCIIGEYKNKNRKRNKFCKEILRKVSSRTDILLLGYLDNSLIPNLYKSAQLVVMPSACNEVAGLVAMEAVLSNTPLIVTDDGGIREYIMRDEATFIKKERLKENIKDSLLNWKKNKAAFVSGGHKLFSRLMEEDSYLESFSKIIEEIDNDGK